MQARAGFVCFGELLLRLNAPGRERMLQTFGFDVHVGGAEANVGVSLAQFGHKVAMAGVVADNALGRAALGELRRHGVDVAHVRLTAGRMGLYFMTSGAVRRPSEILYDRAGSAFAEADADLLDWSVILSHAGWLHLSGVTPAVGEKAAAAAQRAAIAAKSCGVKVSFDGNYRGQLWSMWSGDGPGILRRILGLTDVAFINERDIALVLGQAFDTRSQALAAAFEAFPGLEWIACTTRTQTGVDDHALSGELVSRAGRWTSRVHDLSGVVDRIGAGDAFAAGILHGFAAGLEPQRAVEFAVAAAAIKHSVAGDFNLATVAEVDAAIDADNLDVRR